MAIEREEIYKTYTVANAALLAFIGAGAGEVVDTVILDNRIEIKTKVGTNPITRRTYCISLPDAKTALGVQNGEDFNSVSWNTNPLSMTLITIKRTI